MSTGARGRGRGRGRGQRRGRGRGGANAATQKIIKPQEETVEDNNNDNLLTTDDAPQQEEKNDVTMTEKEENDTPPADAPASAPTNNTNNTNNKKKKQQKRKRKEAENGDVPAVAETNESEPKNEDNDKPVEPPAKRQKTENGDNSPKRQQRERRPRNEKWEPQNQHLKGKTSLIALFNIDPESTVKQLEKLVEEKVGIRPKHLRIIHRMHRQHGKEPGKLQPSKATITFATPEAAITAVEKLSGLKMKDRELKAQYTRELKPDLNEELRGISQVLKLYELYGTTSQDIIDAIQEHCTDVPENLQVKRIYTHGYDYGIVRIDAGSVNAAERIEKELKGKLINNKAALVGYWVPDEQKKRRKNNEQMQVDNE